MSNLNIYASRVHEANTERWVDIETGKPIERNVGEMLMLCVSKLSEALEGYRKGLQNDKLPHRKMFEVEIVDCFIRLFDVAGGLGLDLDGAFEEKMIYNKTRIDHTLEHRKSIGSCPTCGMLMTKKTDEQGRDYLFCVFGNCMDDRRWYLDKRTRVAKPKEDAKRDPVNYRYDILVTSFIRAMAMIAGYGAEKKYGDYNWHKSRLTGQKGPLNHLENHLYQYKQGAPYDHTELGTDRKWHLAAIAFNAMLEWWYEENFTDTEGTTKES